MSTTSQQLRVATDHYQGGNAATYNAIRTKQRRWKAEQVFVESYLESNLRHNPSSNILDMPVGTGRFIPLYQKYQSVVTGVDVSADMLAEAKKLTRDEDTISFVQTDAAKVATAVSQHAVTLSFRFFNFMPLSEVHTIALQIAEVTSETFIVTVWTTPAPTDSTFTTVVQSTKSKLYVGYRYLLGVFGRGKNFLYRTFVTRDILSRLRNGAPTAEATMQTIWHDKDAFIAAISTAGFSLQEETVLDTRFDGSTYYALTFARV